jgi:hypothetical protein
MLRMVMAAVLVAGFPLRAEAADVTAKQVIDGKNRDAVKVYGF